MSIVSTTLAGSGSEKTIVRALTSIEPHVDRCLVIITCPDEDAVIEGRAIEGAGPKLEVKRWTWCDDFGAARNAALDLARELGASWTVTCDSDEWWEDADELRPTLARARDERCFYAYNGSRQYVQPRAIAIPCAKRWNGRVHECLDLRGPALKRARFCEDPKTPEQIRAKAARDLRELWQLAQEEPENPRWRYYLGEALTSAGRYDEAADHFVARAQMNGWGEEAAWACLRAGEIMSVHLNRHDDALELLSAGLARHAGMPELLWHMALCNARLERWDQAIYCAQLARVHGVGGADDERALRRRLLWRTPKALREGPSELLSFLYKAVGEQDAAAKAEQEAAQWNQR